MAPIRSTNDAMTTELTRSQQERRRRELLARSEHVPPMPESVVLLLQLLNNAETEPGDLERHLQTDPILVARMLAMVNSPFYGLSRSISSIREAIMVLGFRGLRSLVLATSTARFLQADMECYGHDGRGLWVHSLCVAAAARALGVRSRLAPEKCELLFVGGLLHDLGKLLLAPFLTEAQQKGKVVDGDLRASERRLFGLDSGEAGALVAAKWNLANDIQEMLEMQRDRTADGDPRLPAAVRLADALACETGYGYLPGRAPHEVPHPDDLGMLGLTDESFHALRAELVATMDTARASMARSF